MATGAAVANAAEGHGRDKMASCPSGKGVSTPQPGAAAASSCAAPRYCPIGTRERCSIGNDGRPVEAEPELNAYKLGKRKCSYNQVELQLVSIVNSMLSCERAVSQDDAGSTPGTNRAGAGGAPPPLRVERMVEDPFAGLAADDDALAIIGNADADSNYVSFSFSVEGGRQLSLQAFVVHAHPEEIPGEGGAREIREDLDVVGGRDAPGTLESSSSVILPPVRDLPSARSAKEEGGIVDSTGASVGAGAFRWTLVSRDQCRRTCKGPILKAIQRYGKLGKRFAGDAHTSQGHQTSPSSGGSTPGGAAVAATTPLSAGQPRSAGKAGAKKGTGARSKALTAQADAGTDAWKQACHMFVAIDEASAHVTPVRDSNKFRLLLAVYDGNDTSRRLIGSTVSAPIRVVANNDVPKGAAFIRMNCPVGREWAGWLDERGAGRIASGPGLARLDVKCMPPPGGAADRDCAVHTPMQPEAFPAAMAPDSAPTGSRKGLTMMRTPSMASSSARRASGKTGSRRELQSKTSAFLQVTQAAAAGQLMEGSASLATLSQPVSPVDAAEIGPAVGGLDRVHDKENVAAENMAATPPLAVPHEAPDDSVLRAQVAARSVLEELCLFPPGALIDFTHVLAQPSAPPPESNEAYTVVTILEHFGLLYRQSPGTTRAPAVGTAAAVGSEGEHTLAWCGFHNVNAALCAIMNRIKCSTDVHSPDCENAVTGNANDSRAELKRLCDIPIRLLMGRNVPVVTEAEMVDAAMPLGMKQLQEAENAPGCVPVATAAAVAATPQPLRDLTQQPLSARSEGPKECVHACEHSASSRVALRMRCVIAVLKVAGMMDGQGNTRAAEGPCDGTLLCWRGAAGVQRIVSAIVMHQTRMSMMMQAAAAQASMAGARTLPAGSARGLPAAPAILQQSQQDQQVLLLSERTRKREDSDAACHMKRQCAM